MASDTQIQVSTEGLVDLMSQRHDLFCAAIEDLRRQFSVGIDDDDADRQSWMEEMESSGHSQVAAFFQDWCERNPIEKE